MEIPRQHAHTRLARNQAALEKLLVDEALHLNLP